MTITLCGDRARVYLWGLSKVLSPTSDFCCFRQCYQENKNGLPGEQANAVAAILPIQHFVNLYKVYFFPWWGMCS